MENMDKDKILEDMIRKLREGADEEEVKKEFVSVFGEDALKELYRKNQGKDIYSSMEKDDVLVLLAEENGALRALSKNILLDLETEDDVSKNMLEDEMERLSQISLHFKKVNILLELLPCDMKEKKVILEEEADILSSLNRLHEKKDFHLVSEEVPSLLQDIEEGIVRENHFLFPYLEENYSFEELSFFLPSFDEVGYCLIKIRS